MKHMENIDEIVSVIQNRLYEMQDIGYRDFQIRLIPGKTTENMIGVRTPQLRKYAGELAGSGYKEVFMSNLPHRYFEENQLHALLISAEKDFSVCIRKLEEFLPYIDNWATCDQCCPKVFVKHRKELVPYIGQWIQSKDTYTIRFGIKMLMSHYLDEDFEVRYPEMAASVRSEEYYVNMMTAWYFATGLAKQYDAILPFLLEEKLDIRTHNKAIQKAVESYRITKEQKDFLRTLKRR